MTSQNRQLLILSAFLVFTLAACSNQEPAPAVTPQAEIGQQDTDAGTRHRVPQLETPFDHVVLDRTGVFNGESVGESSNTLTAEFMTGTLKEITDSLTSSLRSQGFRLSNSEPARGGERHTFHRPGGERLFILIRPRGEVKLLTEGAEGSIYASWRP